MARNRSVMLCECGAKGAVLDTSTIHTWYVRRERACTNPECDKTWLTAEVPLTWVKKLTKLETFLAANGTMKISPAEMRRLAAVNEFINQLDSE